MLQKDLQPIVVILLAVNALLLGAFIVAFRWLRKKEITLSVGIAMGICGLFILLFGSCTLMWTGSLILGR